MLMSCGLRSASRPTHITDGSITCAGASAGAGLGPRSGRVSSLGLGGAVVSASAYTCSCASTRLSGVAHFTLFATGVGPSGSSSDLIKDYSADADSAALVHTFWALASALDIDVWFVFVNSAANVADWPSRGMVAFAADLCAHRIEGEDLRMPPRASWGSAQDALRHAGVEAGDGRMRSRKRKRL